MPNAYDNNPRTASRTGRPDAALAAPGERPPVPARPSLGTRLLGWVLLSASVGLVSCQSLFVL